MKIAARNTADAEGYVRVIIQLWKGERAVKGNMTRSIGLREAKVSKVFKLIKETLEKAAK